MGVVEHAKNGVLIGGLIFRDKHIIISIWKPLLSSVKKTDNTYPTIRTKHPSTRQLCESSISGACQTSEGVVSSTSCEICSNISSCWGGCSTSRCRSRGDLGRSILTLVVGRTLRQMDGVVILDLVSAPCLSWLHACESYHVV